MLTTIILILAAIYLLSILTISSTLIPTLIAGTVCISSLVWGIYSQNPTYLIIGIIWVFTTVMAYFIYENQK